MRRYGSKPGKGRNKNRRRAEGALQLNRDYFMDNSTYDYVDFQRRFRAPKPVFFRLFSEVCRNDSYFLQKMDALGVLGLTSEQNLCAWLQMLAYGTEADSFDKYFRIAESKMLVSIERFTKSVINIFKEEYLRTPTAIDKTKILARSRDRGFPGKIGSIDCSKWKWKNSPTAWSGQLTGKKSVPTLTIDAVVDDRLWIWHLFFGMPGSANDISVLNISPLMNIILEEKYPFRVEYTIANEKRTNLYFLADGIYPRWTIFMTSYSIPRTMK
jgi:Plant transposon protein